MYGALELHSFLHNTRTPLDNIWVYLDNFSQLIPRSCAATLDKGQSTEIIPSKVFDGVKRSCGVILDNSEDITDSKIDAEIMWDDFGKS